jgi:hypothetical protein
VYGFSISGTPQSGPIDKPLQELFNLLLTTGPADVRGSGSCSAPHSARSAVTAATSRSLSAANQ